MEGKGIRGREREREIVGGGGGEGGRYVYVEGEEARERVCQNN